MRTLASIENPLFSQASMSAAAAASSRPLLLNQPIAEHSPQSLRQGNHLLSHGHWREDVVDEMCGRLRHVPAVQSVRETARLIQCRNNLKQLAVGLLH